jgi:hypothetical protein
MGAVLGHVQVFKIPLNIPRRRRIRKRDLRSSMSRPLVDIASVPSFWSNCHRSENSASSGGRSNRLQPCGHNQTISVCRSTVFTSSLDFWRQPSPRPHRRCLRVDTPWRSRQPRIPSGSCPLAATTQIPWPCKASCSPGICSGHVLSLGSDCLYSPRVKFTASWPYTESLGGLLTNL